jgi:DNA-binding NarL/FixJ family response regulator
MSPTVLVVDDDPAFRDLATRLLTEWGYQVVGVAGTVADALAQAGRLRPEAALVDIALPDGNGFDLATGLLELAWPIRVVLISSDPDRAFTMAAHRIGARGFLAKDQLAGAALRDLMMDAEQSW